MGREVNNSISGNVGGWAVQAGDVVGDIDLSGGPDGGGHVSINGLPVMPVPQQESAGPGDTARLASVVFHIRSRIDALNPGRPHTDAMIDELHKILDVAQQR